MFVSDSGVTRQRYWPTLSPSSKTLRSAFYCDQCAALALIQVYGFSTSAS